MSSIKKYIPPVLHAPIKKVYSNYKIKSLYKYDLERFHAGYTPTYKNATVEQLEFYLIFFSHSLEKGMSRSTIRFQFGKGVLQSLADVLGEYITMGYDKNRIKYQITLATIKNYILLHEMNSENTDFLLDLFTADFLEEVRESDESLAGIVEVLSNDKTENNKKTFSELVTSRRSVREYSDEPVDLNKIEEAITLALKTPSVCNRQASKIRVIKDEEKIKAALTLQKGFKGYELPPILMLVTASNDMLVSPIERNESFIDGGLFSMSVLYSLECVGLAACALNAMLSVNVEKEIKTLLGIPEQEALIMFISVGNFREITKTPKSKRVGLDDVMTII